jgi:hypothetical protein
VKRKEVYELIESEMGPCGCKSQPWRADQVGNYVNEMQATLRKAHKAKGGVDSFDRTCEAILTLATQCIGFLEDHGRVGMTGVLPDYIAKELQQLAIYGNLMIYIDMDGVVANFDKRFREMFGCSIEDMTDKPVFADFWARRCANEFFTHLDAIPEGIEMVDEIYSLGLPCAFLTSTGGGFHHYGIARQKSTWLARHFSNAIPVIFCTGTASKAAFAGLRSLLIDDREKVLTAFIGAGGSGVLFTPDRYSEIVQEVVAFEESFAGGRA